MRRARGLQLPRRPETAEVSMNGTLIWFNPAKRHGFIRTEEGERLLVEASGFEPGHLLGDRCAGTPVTFVRQQDDVDDVARAVGVSVVPSVVARRARTRHR